MNLIALLSPSSGLNPHCYFRGSQNELRKSKKRFPITFVSTFSITVYKPTSAIPVKIMKIAWFGTSCVIISNPAAFFWLFGILHFQITSNKYQSCSGTFKKIVHSDIQKVKIILPLDIVCIPSKLTFSRQCLWIKSRNNKLFNVIALHYIPVQHSIGSVAILSSAAALPLDGWPHLAI